VVGQGQVVKDARPAEDVAAAGDLGRSGRVEAAKKTEFVRRNHRYLNKSTLLKFVMCRLLALPFPREFLQQPPTVLTRETRQAVHEIYQSIFLQMSMK
jgi:hypothetical protein